jgi:hypothetical protein
VSSWHGGEGGGRGQTVSVNRSVDSLSWIGFTRTSIN